jgi:hypothetical protein
MNSVRVCGEGAWNQEWLCMCMLEVSCAGQIFGRYLFDCMASHRDIDTSNFDILRMSWLVANCCKFGFFIIRT